MNWKKLLLGITAVNLIAWAGLELYWHRYADSDINVGAGCMVFAQLVAYYVVAIGSVVPESQPKMDENFKFKPHNCPGHQWFQHPYNTNAEECIVCKAERGKNKV